MQRLSPLEVQKQTFAKAFKGYSVDEVRSYLDLLSEELELLLKENEKLARDNSHLREEVDQHNERERILKDTLLAAQRAAEDLRTNAQKEAELIVKDAELLADRIVGQAMTRVADLEGVIQDLKINRRAARMKLQGTIDMFQQLLVIDAEQESNELPLTQMYRKSNEG